jgi:hypothetical protein
MTLLALLAEDAGSVSYPVFAGAIVGIFTTLGSVIAMLYRRVEKDATKCQEDRANDQKERAAENKTWADRIEALHAARAAENKAWFDKSEALYREHGSKTEKMLDQVIKLTEKSKDTEYATIGAITHSSKSMLEVAQAVNTLPEKLGERRT